MNQGYWTLIPGVRFKVREYDRGRDSCMLYQELTGPFLLIDRRLVALLADLHEPQTTQQVQDRLGQAGVDAAETGALLATLEKAGVLVHAQDRPSTGGRLDPLPAQDGPMSEPRFRSLTLAAAVLLALMAAHLTYLLATRASWLTSVRRAPMIEDYLILLALIIVFSVLHEAAHGLVLYLACGRFPWPVSWRPMSALLLLPVPRVNLNMTYLLDSRARRVAILAAGLGTDLALIWSSFLMLIATRQAPPWVYFSWFAAFAFLLDLVPLWTSDGYYILSEVARAPDLGRRATDALKRLVTGKAGASKGLALYAAGKIFFESALLVAFLVVWYRLASLMGDIGRAFFWTVFAGIFIFKFVQGYRAHNRHRR